MRKLNPIVEDYMARASKKLFEATQIKDNAFAYGVLTSLRNTLEEQIQICLKEGL
jgi:hypothetical protein